MAGNEKYLFVLPSNSPEKVARNYLVVERKSGRFHHFTTNVEDAQVNTKWTLDPTYDILWAYELERQSVSAYTCWSIGDEKGRRGVWEFVRCPEFWIPTSNSDSPISPDQMGFSLLSTIYSLTMRCQDLQIQEMKQSSSNMDFSQRNGDNAYRTVDRFQNYGGGWGYSAQSVEAVQFQPSQDIQLLGLGLYGGRGEYVVKMKLLRLVGQDYDERNLEMLAESEEMIYDCASREKAHLFFSRPVNCTSGHWYIAWAQIK